MKMDATCHLKLKQTDGGLLLPHAEVFNSRLNSSCSTGGASNLTDIMTYSVLAAFAPVV